jgi:hypothetical protein
MTNQHPQQPATKPAPAAATPHPEDLAAKHLLDQPPDPSPAPNPESAPGGDKVGGDMPTAPFTGAPLKDQPPSHKDQAPHK